MKGVDKPKCEAVIGTWPGMDIPKTCGLPGEYIRNPSTFGWPAYYKLCEAHRGLAEMREEP